MDEKNKLTGHNSINNFIRDKNGVYIRSNNQESFYYSDGKDAERRVLKALRSVRDLSTSSDELKNKINDWVSEYHFSQERHNLLRHLNLDSKSKILELGCGCGAITRQLGESGAQVTAIEGSYVRACSAAARCRDISNVKVYCSKFQDINLTDQYDIITLIGVLEYSPLFFDSDDPVAECLKVATRALKSEGVVIIAIENQLGLKYFCGYSEDHVDIPFYGIEDRYNSKTAITYGRKELMRKIQSTGLCSVEFQYPFPDYKIPKVVFTQKAFNNKLFHPEEILRQVKYRDYSTEASPLFEQGMTIPVLCRNGILEDLSNSFLILASQNKQSINNLGEKNLLAAFYTTDRVSAYNTKTSFVKIENEIIVRKDHLSSSAFPLAHNSVLVQDLREAKYIDGKNLEAEYRRCIMIKDYVQFSRLLSLQLKFLVKHAIIEVNSNNIVLSEIHPDYIDCVPSNLILKDGKLHYFDREWKIRTKATFGTLLLRTIDAIHELDRNQPELNRENLIREINKAGYAINNNALDEYNYLIQEIVSQVYLGKRYEVDSIKKRKTHIHEFIEYIKDDLKLKKRKYPENKLLWERLSCHIDEMLKIYRGQCSKDYFEKLNALGGVHKNEPAICEILLREMSGDDAWRNVNEFTKNLINQLKMELNSGSSHSVGVSKINSIRKYKKYNYGNEFKQFICPNPFLYIEYVKHGEISCCCYLPFSLGSILKKNFNEIWNSEIAQELRRSILSGEYSYCDKSRCAAMQAAVIQQKKNVFKYQIPYQLLDKKYVKIDILKSCITFGKTDNLPNPKIISFEDDPSCNLSCPSCRKTVFALKADDSNLALSAQKMLLDSIGSNIEELWFCGAGEVLAASSYRKLLKLPFIKKFAKTGFRIDTNAMLFNSNAWETTLKNIQQNLKLVAVSLDATTEKTYKKIRRGGEFKIVMKNLNFIASLPQRKQGMSFIIRMIVQQKNYKEMKKFVELGRSLGVDSVVFSVIQNWGTFSTEEYRNQAVHLDSHTEHNDLCSVLQDKIFLEDIVDLGNLAEIHYIANLKNAPLTPSIKASTVITLPRNECSSRRARVIAFYLPQYHPIPENDQWWGKGFTEWTNVKKAKPIYKGHYQPHLPKDLGYYDLRRPEARNAQAALAKQYGIEAFCYWHYWFAGHRLLEKPFNEVVRTGQPDFPFCLGWANQTWSGIWHGAPNRILIEQTYPGIEDYKLHFYTLLSAFQDPRYLKINKKLVFLIYSPTQLPDARFFTDYWQELAIKEGLPGFHFIGHMTRFTETLGCQSCVDNAPFYDMKAPLLEVEPIGHANIPKVFSYLELVKYLKRYKLAENEHPIVFPNWDNTPRSGSNGVVLHGSTPELFSVMMKDAVEKAQSNPDAEKRIVFIKAWNEWAEGNHLEPDNLHGHAYLEVIRKSICTEREQSSGKRHNFRYHSYV